MPYENELIRLLRKEKNYKEEELIKRFKMTKKEFYELSLYIIEDKVKKLNFDSDPNRYKYLYKIFKYFDNIDEENIVFVTEKLREINLYCKQKTEEILKENNEKTKDNNIFTKIADIIDVTLIRIDFNQNSTHEIDGNTRNYVFLKELIYKVKNYDYVYEIFRTLPNLLLTTNKRGISILDEVVEKYIETVIDSENHYDILYLEKVIKIFLNSDKFPMDKDYKAYLVNKILLSLDRIKKSKVRKSEVKRIEFFLIELIQDIRDSKKNIYLDDLNYKYKVVDIFSEEILREAKFANNLDKHDYIDLRDKFLITIDNIGTILYDDSYYFEKQKDGTYLLGVFTPDVDSFLYPTSLLEENAYLNGESIYTYKHQVPLFPYEFSHKLTLIQNYDRFAIGYFFKLDSQMNLIEFYAKRAIINVNHNLYYNDVDNILKTSNNVQVFNTLKEMIKVVETIKSTQIYNHKYREVKKIKRTIMNGDDVNVDGSILSTFNVLVNHLVAEYFDKHDFIAFPYYVNLAQYDDALIKELKLKIYSGDSFESVLNCLNQVYVPSFYSVQNKGHNGLNLTSYSTPCNPLRQYASILTQRLVKRHMIDKVNEPLIDIEQMEEICEHLNNRRKINDEYKREYVKYLRSKNSI